MSGHRPVAHAAAMGVATVVAERAVAFVVILVLARVLTPEEFGRYGYALAGLALVQVLVDQGVEVAAVARRAAQPSTALVRTILAWRGLVWGLLAVPMGVFLLPRLGGPTGVGPAVGFAASLLVLVGPSITARGLRRARGDLPGMARIALTDAVAGGTAVVASALSGASLVTLFAARAATSLVVSAFALARERDGGDERVTIRGLMAVAAPLAASALLIAVQTRAGHLVAMSVAGPVVVGQLAAAARATEILGVLPEGALLAVFPRMAAAPEAAAALAAGTARVLAVAVLVPVVALTVAGGWVMGMLFGPPFTAAGDAVAILAWSALLSVTGGVILHAVVARGHQRHLVAANVVAAAGGIALQVALVARFGLVGAASATVATGALGQLALLGLSDTRPLVVSVWRAALPAALVAGLVAGAACAVRRDVAGAAVAVVAYAGLAIAGRLVTAREWRALRDVIARRG